EAAKGAQAKLRHIHRSQKVSIIPNGLNTEFFKPGPLRPDDGIFRIGMVSRLQANKDHVSLVAAFDNLRKLRPEKSFKLYIAGDGVTRSLIVGEIEQRGLQDAVVMCGLLN